MRFIKRRKHKYFENKDFDNDSFEWDFVGSLKSAFVWEKNNKKKQYKKDYEYIKSYIERLLKRKIVEDWSSSDTIYYYNKINTKKGFKIRFSNHWGNFENSNNKIVIPKNYNKKIYKWKIGIMYF